MNPTISIDDPELITDLVTSNLSQDFSISYSNLNAFINLEYTENGGPDRAKLTGDLGTLTIGGEINITP